MFPDDEEVEVAEAKPAKPIRPELKQFMQDLGLDEEVMQRRVPARNPLAKNTAQSAGQHMQNMMQQLTQAAGIPPGMIPSMQPVTNPHGAVTNAPAQLAHTGGIIVKGEIRVEDKYVDSVKGVMQGIKTAVLNKDEDDMVELTDEQAHFIEEMVNMLDVKETGTGTVLDQALIQEMGKAYKERFEIAKAAGDDTTMNRAYGSMLALKKVMEMVK